LSLVVGYEGADKSNSFSYSQRNKKKQRRNKVIRGLHRLG